ncbi:hypothetical protein ACO0K9_26780 [Undibacterium sp. Ji50W]|uniref:hypothetical protein n=1 Tax=Undibacterium sp. Ji50W TaxID=3413041 RepID=UPI003BF0D75C
MRAVIDQRIVEDIADCFRELTAIVPLHAIRNETEYDRAVSILNALLDAGAAEEGHQLADLVDILGSIIGDYEDAQ